MALGVNFILRDNKLTLEPYPHWITLRNDYPALEKEYLAFELDKTDPNSLNTEQKRALENVSNNWWASRDSNP